MLALMGRMLGQVTRLKARHPTLAYANVPLYFFLHCSHLLSFFWEGNGGCSEVCIVPCDILGEVTHQTAPVKTP